MHANYSLLSNSYKEYNKNLHLKDFVLRRNMATCYIFLSDPEYDNYPVFTSSSFMKQIEFKYYNEKITIFHS